MTKELLPPPASSEATGAHARRPRSTAVVVAATLPAQDATRHSPLVRVVKWPLRKVLKALYLMLVAVRGHRVASAVLALILAGLVGSGAVIYRATHPGAGISLVAGGISGPPGASAPFTVYVLPALPPLPASVLDWCQGHQTFSASEVWSSYSATEQQTLAKGGVTESALQSDFDTAKSQGFTFTQFVETGGYHSPTGTSHYLVEVYIAQGNQAGVHTYYFLVDQDGKIEAATDLTQPQG